ncbi:MAG: penicillin acylase family protein [Acetobacteraceae bacterium]
MGSRRRIGTIAQRLGLAAAALIILILLGVAAAGWAVWQTLPPSSQTIAISGLTAPVTVTLDADGVPFIRAANLEDAATALGYLHARSRMFQMALLRRLVAGTLAEWFGPAALRSDELMRTLGLARHAQATLATLPKATRDLLDAYARGVNAWIKERGRFAAPQFLLLGRPEPWTAVDSLYWGAWMSFSLSGDWRRELARLALTGKLPNDRILALWPLGHGDKGIDASLAALRSTAAHLLAFRPVFPPLFAAAAPASNEWAVAGDRSATGAPLLAGDPHLGLAFPSLWYLARIETPHTTLAGATAPGVPFLVLGHNRHVAWTFTDTGADTEDLFIEQPLGGGRYQTPGGPKPFGTRREIIHVRGRPDVVLTVRTTRHGPVISDLVNPKGPVLALAMAELAPHDTAATGLLALNRATTIAQAGLAAGEISTPVLNLLVADKENIGFFMTGRLPIRRAGDGAMPVPGADGAYDWTGFTAGTELPHVVDPPSGVLVNANNRIDLPGFPVFITRDWFGPWRARRIRQMLAAHPKATVAEFAAMQHDALSTYAEQLLPVLRRVRPPPGLSTAALRLFEHWRGEMAMDMPQPLIFNAWLRHFRALLFARLGIPDNGAAPGPEFIAGVLGDGGYSRWCAAPNVAASGDGSRADCSPLLRHALDEATAALAARYGGDAAAWRWGKAHPARFVDPVLERIPLLGWLTACRIATPGDDTTVDRGSPAPPGFRNVQGAEYRGVYDLADLDRSRFMMAPGQAGNPFGRHACDLVRPWRDGRSFVLGPTPNRVSATIRILP